MPQALNETRPEQLIARGEALLVALESTGSARAAATFRAIHGRLVEATSAQARAAAEIDGAVRLRDAADERLDATVAELSLAALELTGDDAADPVFGSLFPDGPQSMTTVPVNEEVQLVHGLLAKLRGHPLAARFQHQLEVELEDVEQADRRLSQALSEEATTHATLRRATVTWLLQARVVQGDARKGRST